MTKKDYIQIAESFRYRLQRCQSPEGIESIRALSQDLERTLKQDNSSFQKETFRYAIFEPFEVFDFIPNYLQTKDLYIGGSHSLAHTFYYFIYKGDQYVLVNEMDEYGIIQGQYVKRIEWSTFVSQYEGNRSFEQKFELAKKPDSLFKIPDCIDLEYDGEPLEKEDLK